MVRCDMDFDFLWHELNWVNEIIDVFKREAGGFVFRIIQMYAR